MRTPEGDAPWLALEDVLPACDIAAGRKSPAPSDDALMLTGAFRRLNCNGNGTEWYMMVWRHGRWQYVAPPLPRRGLRAAQRKCEAEGPVFLGEIVAKHYYREPIESVWLVTGRNSLGLAQLVETEFAPTRDGNLRVTLPNGERIFVPNPRR